MADLADLIVLPSWRWAQAQHGNYFQLLLGLQSKLFFTCHALVADCVSGNMRMFPRVTAVRKAFFIPSYSLQSDELSAFNPSCLFGAISEDRLREISINLSRSQLELVETTQRHLCLFRDSFNVQSSSSSSSLSSSPSSSSAPQPSTPPTMPFLLRDDMIAAERSQESSTSPSYSSSSSSSSVSSSASSAEPTSIAAS